MHYSETLKFSSRNMNKVISDHWELSLLEHTGFTGSFSFSKCFSKLVKYSSVIT